MKTIEFSKDKSKNNYDNLPNIVFEVKNVVATASLHLEKKLDLVKITAEVSGAEYNPEKFPGVIYRIQDPKATFLIFSTGKMVLTGLKDPEVIKPALGKLSNDLKKIGISFSEVTSKVENLVISGDFKHNVDLNLSAVTLDHIMYEPEVFPGLVYYMADPKAVFLIFSTGKFVCTGSKDLDPLTKAIYKIYQILEENDLILKEGYPPNKSRDELVFY